MVKATITLPLEKFFENKRGKSTYTKAYCHKNQGKYEVYTGTTKGKFGSIDTFDYEIPTLTYTTDGAFAGTVNIIRDKKYNIGGHRAVLSPKDENISLDYFEQILGAEFKKLVKEGSVPSINWQRIKSIPVSVPIDEDGNYDLKQQNEFAEKYQAIKNRKLKLEKMLKVIDESYITIPNEKVIYKTERLSNLFSYERGKSRTKAFSNTHKGNIPVWSANSSVPMAYVDFYDYNGDYITLSRNGIAGKIMILHGKFSINEDRFVLIPKVGNLDYNFMKYTLEPLLRTSKKGRVGYDGQNEFTKISFAILDKISIKIPVLADGNFDLVGQQNIAEKYLKLDEIKLSVTSKIRSLIDSEIT